MTESEILQALDVGEDRDWEFKLATGGLSRDLWETYSAMANSDGGTPIITEGTPNIIGGAPNITKKGTPNITGRTPIITRAVPPTHSSKLSVSNVCPR